MLFDLPDNFQFSPDQLAQIIGCHRDTVINNTHPSKKGTRYFIQSHRATPKAPIKIFAKDAIQYLQNSQRGFLPSQNEQQ